MGYISEKWSYVPVVLYAKKALLCNPARGSRRGYVLHAVSVRGKRAAHWGVISRGEKTEGPDT